MRLEKKQRITPDDETKFRMNRVSTAPMHRSEDRHFYLKPNESESDADRRWTEEERKKYYLALSDGIFYKVRNPHTREVYEDEKGRITVIHYKPIKVG